MVALPASSFLEVGPKRHNLPKGYFSGEASHVRAIALGNAAIPIQSQSKHSRHWIDITGSLVYIQDSNFPGRTQLFPYSNLPQPLMGNVPPPATAALPAASSGEDEDGDGSSGIEEDDGNDSDSAPSDGEAVEDIDQQDADDDELDEGEYGEDDLEVELSSWGDDDDDNDGDADEPQFFTANFSDLSAWAAPVPGNAPLPLGLESYLPNDTGQSHEQFVENTNTYQLTEARNTFAIARQSQVPAPGDRVPGEAADQRGEDVDNQPAPCMAMIYAPHRGMTYREPDSESGWFNWLTQRKEYNMAKREQSQEEIEALGEYTSFFITGEKDIRLMNTNRHFVDIYCQEPLNTKLSHPVYPSFCRINMTLHVPELNLMVAACQSGRVALISLLKSSWARPNFSGDRSMRVDWILPTASEEVKRKARPKVPLFGIAVGPVQEVEDGTLRLRLGSGKLPSSFSCTYRLVLHYRDHTILSYTVSRPSPDDLKVI